MANTSRLSLRYPVASDTADVPRDIGNLASDLDKAAIFSKGTFASRPTSTVGSPGIDGRYYFATDTSRLYLDTGTSWVEVDAGSAPAGGDLTGTLSNATIGTGAVTSAKILDGTIATGDIADSAVTSAKIADGTVAVGDLASAVGNFGAWSTYTPSLTSSGTTPNLGTNGSTRGTYVQIGKAVFAQVFLKFGSTSASVGTGNYRVSLPVTGVSANNTAVIGRGHVFDSNINVLWEVTALQLSTTTLEMVYVNSNNSFGRASATGPQTTAPDTNDYYDLSICYEAA